MVVILSGITSKYEAEVITSAFESNPTGNESATSYTTNNLTTIMHNVSKSSAKQSIVKGSHSQRSIK